MLKIVNIDVRVKDGSSLAREFEEIGNSGCKVSVFESTSDLLDSGKTTLPAFGPDTVVLVRVAGDLHVFRKWESILETANSHSSPILVVNNLHDKSLPYRYLNDLDDVEYFSALGYWELGGHQNLLNLARLLTNHYCGTGFAIEPPQRPPAQGAYHPGTDSIDIAYHISLLDRSKPTIALLVSQRKWNSGKLGQVDAIIREIESQGGNCLTIFLTYAVKQATGSIGISGIIDNYLLEQGAPVVDAVINTISSSILMESRASGDPDDGFLCRLGTPVIQSPVLVYSEEEWIESAQGLTNAEIAYDVAFPEFDGQIISIPHASTEKDESNNTRYKALESRVPDLAEMALRWARLHRKQNNEKKIAILFYQYPPAISHAGGAADLDTFQSIRDLMERMHDAGYNIPIVPDTSKELVDLILGGITNDIESISDEDIRNRAAAFMDRSEYSKCFESLSKEQQEFIKKDWGDPPGNVLVVNDSIAVPGIIDGNIILSFQPNRGKDIQASYHNHNCSIPHQYFSFYRWLRDDFDADAVIHVGTHGTLEWLPGKSVGLSKDCSPDYVLCQMPNIYPYVIGNPGEGTEAKRRSYAVLVDHMIPAMRCSGDYPELSELESILQQFMRVESMKTAEKHESLEQELFETVRRMNLFTDMGLKEDATLEEVVALADELYDYVLEIKSGIFKDGLHIIGKIPEGIRLEEMVYSLTRLRNDTVPSLLESIAESEGFDYEALVDRPSEFDSATGKLNGELWNEVNDNAIAVISALREMGFRQDCSRKWATETYPSDNGKLLEVVDFICNSLYPNICKITEESDHLLDAMDGRFVPPGPSGCPTRGRAQILPTGRNFFTVDPEAIPFRSSWSIGKKMADQMVERYVDDHGAYPESISIVLWATDTMKTGGDDVAYVLSLMGVRPKWIGDKVVGVELIPLDELKRPRIDVTVNISGLFRDTFPNLTAFVNEAVEMVAELDETDEENFIRKNYREDLEAELSRNIPRDLAREYALARVFGCQPGQYGTGVNVLVSTSKWNNREELGNYFIDVGSYIYRGELHGVKSEDRYRRRLSRTKVTVKNSTSREYDLIDNDDVFQYLGGLNAAVKAVTGTDPMSVIGCSADTSRPTLRTITEELCYTFRNKVLNPAYERGLREHGFRGATEILKMFEYTFGWDATSDIVQDWMYKDLAENYLIDDEIRGWMEEANPHAVQDMLDVLMEAVERSMWNPEPEMLEKLKELYLKVETLVEETDDRH